MKNRWVEICKIKNKIYKQKITTVRRNKNHKGMHFAQLHAKKFANVDKMDHLKKSPER